MKDLWGQIIGAAIGAIIAGVIGVITAHYTIRLQNKAQDEAEKRARRERADLIRFSLAAEIELAAEGIDVLSNNVAKLSVAAAMSTLGTFNVRIYPGVIPQLGVLGSETAAQVVGLYANLEHLIDRGREIDDRLKAEGSNPQIDADAVAWFRQAQVLHAGMLQTAADLRRGITV